MVSRYTFKAKFGKDNFEARTDGVLRILGEPERVCALVECKAAKRGQALPEVQFQEAAQIVGWLLQKHHPGAAETGRYVYSSNSSFQDLFINTNITFQDLLGLPGP